MSTCPWCDSERKIQCPICGGIGLIYPQTTDRVKCDGLPGIDCPNCDGSGKIDSWFLPFLSDD